LGLMIVAIAVLTASIEMVFVGIATTFVAMLAWARHLGPRHRFAAAAISFMTGFLPFVLPVSLVHGWLASLFFVTLAAWLLSVVLVIMAVATRTVSQ
jgi:hypothetical protein